MANASVPFSPHPLALRDGRKVTVRLVVPDDAAAVLALERALVHAGLGVVRAPEDLPADADEMRAKLQRRLGGSDHRGGGIRVVAIDSHGGVAGSAEVVRYGPALLRHTAMLGLGVHPDYQGQGLGRLLMASMLQWARESLATEDPILRLELYVRADNHRAIRLYESLGFTTEGIRRGLVRLADGTLVDDHVMALILQRQALASPD